MTRATLRQGGSEGQSGTQYSRGNDPRVWQRFGALAVSLGFRTEEAEYLAAQDGEHELAAQLVNRAEIGDVAAGEVTQRIAMILRHAQQQSSGFAAANKSRRAMFAGEEWLPSERRCGKPFDKDHDLDRGSLFLPMMYVTPDQPSENVSTLYCKWEMFRGFFGLHKVRSDTRFLLWKFGVPKFFPTTTSKALPLSSSAVYMPANFPRGQRHSVRHEQFRNHYSPPTIYPSENSKAVASLRLGLRLGLGFGRGVGPRLRRGMFVRSASAKVHKPKVNAHYRISH